MSQRWRIHNSLLFIVWLHLITGWRCLLWRHSYKKNYMENKEKKRKQTLLFIRHGQTTWNVEHRLPGQLPGVQLNETGKEQVSRLREALNVLPISTVISSPLERAVETATIVKGERELTIQMEPALKDTDVGPWAGQVIKDLNQNDPNWKEFVRDPTQAPEGIETFPQVQQRAVAAVENWRQKEENADYLAFIAHADVIKLLVAHYSGLEVKRAGSLMIDNASVSIVEIEEEQTPHIVAIGWNPRPGWLKPPAPPQTEEQSRQEPTAKASAATENKEK